MGASWWLWTCTVVLTAGLVGGVLTVAAIYVLVWFLTGVDLVALGMGR